MRIFNDYFVCLSSPSGGWVEGESILFIEQNTFAKSCRSPSTLPPSGRCWTRSINIGVIRNPLYAARYFLQQASFSSDFITNGE